MSCGDYRFVLCPHTRSVSGFLGIPRFVRRASDTRRTYINQRQVDAKSDAGDANASEFRDGGDRQSLRWITRSAVATSAPSATATPNPGCGSVSVGVVPTSSGSVAVPSVVVVVSPFAVVPSAVVAVVLVLVSVGSPCNTASVAFRRSPVPSVTACTYSSAVDGARVRNVTTVLAFAPTVTARDSTIRPSRTYATNVDVDAFPVFAMRVATA